MTNPLIFRSDDSVIKLDVADQGLYLDIDDHKVSLEMTSKQMVQFATHLVSGACKNHNIKEQTLLDAD